MSTYYRIGGSVIKNGFSGDIDIWYSSKEDFDQAMVGIKTSCRRVQPINNYKGRDHAARLEIFAGSKGDSDYQKMQNHQRISFL